MGGDEAKGDREGRGDEKSQVPGEHFNLGARREPCEARDSTICFPIELQQCPLLKLRRFCFCLSAVMMPKSATGEIIAIVSFSPRCLRVDSTSHFNALPHDAKHSFGKRPGWGLCWGVSGNEVFSWYKAPINRVQ